MRCHKSNDIVTNAINSNMEPFFLLLGKLRNRRLEKFRSRCWKQLFLLLLLQRGWWKRVWLTRAISFVLHSIHCRHLVNTSCSNTGKFLRHEVRRMNYLSSKLNVVQREILVMCVRNEMNVCTIKDDGERGKLLHSPPVKLWPQNYRWL
jgi:hypothetical protein